MSGCNYCSLERLKKQTEGQDFEILIHPRATELFPDGVDVYFQARNRNPMKTYVITWKAWFAEIPTRCVCSYPMGDLDDSARW
jgi:hypothetical protein